MENPRDLKAVLAEFGQFVRLQRKGLGITQEELAQRSGLHRTYVTDVERGVRNMTFDSALKLTNALNIPFADASYRPGVPTVGKLLSSPDGSVDILLVEDNSNDAELTQVALQQFAVSNRVVTVGTGSDALRYVFGEGGRSNGHSPTIPKVILLDLRLPDMSGLDVLRKVRNDDRTRHIPAVILTASRSDQDFRESIDLGVTGYLTKPIDMGEFGRLMPKLGLRWMLVAQD